MVVSDFSSKLCRHEGRQLFVQGCHTHTHTHTCGKFASSTVPQSSPVQGAGSTYRLRQVQQQQQQQRIAAMA